MRWNSCAFFCGILLLDQFSALPSWPWLLLALAAGVTLWKYLHHAALWLALGCCWAAQDGAAYLSRLLPEPLERAELLIEGRVASLPAADDTATRFLLHVDDASLPGSGPLDFGGLVKLNWRGPQQRPRGGERWRLRVRLRQPRGFMNPGGLDYERWLFRQDIVATGYVRESAQNRRVAEAGWSPLALRQSLRERIAARAGASPARGVLNALLIGDRGGLGESEWQLFRATGTSHLVAISGLHIGLVALLAWTLVSALWRHAGKLPLWLPAPVAGAWGALLAAAGYAMLAGFSVPTQRALVMTAVFSLAVILRRNSRPLDGVALALLLVLLIDPRAPLAAGFWLSFTAVGVILLLIGRYPQWRGWRMWIAIQLGLFVALLPLLVLWDLPAAPLAPLVNLLVVPWFSFVIVPGVLLTALLLLLAAPGAGLLLQLLLQCITLTLEVLQIAAGQGELIALSPVSWWLALPAAAGALLLLLARRWYWRVAGAPLLLLLTWQQSAAVGHLAVSVLDVGQGQSLVVETRGHTLVYDLGPQYPGGFNTAAAVVIPWLRSRGRDHVDMLVLSHDDNDHTGGAVRFVEQVRVDAIVTGQQMPRFGFSSSRCHDAAPWRWDGVSLRFLKTTLAPRSDNDASCILLLEHAGGRVLISGDVTARVESALLGEYGELLRADLATMPHHGSRTSSSPAFIRGVNARQVIVSAGWKSRYGHPQEEILQRWRESGAAIDNTAESGAIRIAWDGHGGRTVTRYRHQARRFWHR